MRYIIILLLIAGNNAFAQYKPDAELIRSLQSHISYLADDKLEGRRTGSNGERLAREFIIREFKNSGISGITEDYLQAFQVNEVNTLMPGNTLEFGDHGPLIAKNYFPLAWSANAKIKMKRNKMEADTFDIAELLKENKTNPHFDLQSILINRAQEAGKNGKKALFVFNTSDIVDNLKFDEKDKTSPASIPVIYVMENAMNMVRRKEKIKLEVNISRSMRSGHNVIGYINNNAATTVVLGAHYDHLGYGEDHNSLYTGKDKMVHNGADDNASGTAALIELAKLLRSNGPKNNNYLFIAFSGEELGLFGSKYFTENMPSGISKINYMINMDMVGRLNDSTHGLTIGGYGTSPLWSTLIDTNDPYFKIKVDSSGSGPSDHTSFYRKDIPVLFFFTGTHADYHKPTDDAAKINYTGTAKIIGYIYELIRKADNSGAIAFTKTREVSMGKSSFKVSLGIMPDYTFSGSGVLVDGVTEGRAAQKAGIKTGDVLVQLGEHTFNDVQSYMSALNKFNKGESTKVRLIRGKEDLTFDISF